MSQFSCQRLDALEKESHPMSPRLEQRVYLDFCNEFWRGLNVHVLSVDNLPDDTQGVVDDLFLEFVE